MKAFLLAIAAFPALAWAQPSPVWKPYIEQGDVQARIKHLRTLDGLPTAKNLILVVGALTDPEEPVRRVSREILVKNKSLATFDLIVAGMPNGSQYEAGLLLASDFREPKYVQRMVKLLKHEDAGIRRPMAMALGIIKDERAFLPLIQMARDPNPLAREIARNSLTNYKEPRHKASLQKLVKHEDERIRNMANDVLRAQG